MIERDVQEISQDLVDIRRDLHAHPELGFELSRTAGVVTRELERLGLRPRTGVGRSGVLAEIGGGQDGRCLLIRADMDALPIEERTGLPFASRERGRMHACGHDLHTATLIGIARTLAKRAPRLHGRVRLMFQPAEEITTSGARAMIEDGALDGVDAAIGFHNDPSMSVGTFGYIRGASMAAADNFEVELHGQSGHAASPHKTVDPILAAAHVITQLQTIVAREIDPGQGAVLTVAHIDGGSVDNAIPDSCRFGGTIRTRSPVARATAEAAFRRILAGVELTFRVRCELAWRPGVPPLMNDDATLDAVLASIEAQFGHVIRECAPGFGSEDFAYVAERLPTAHIHIGAGAAGRHDSLHNTDYQPDEACIALGVAGLSRAALDFLASDNHRRTLRN